MYVQSSICAFNSIWYFYPLKCPVAIMCTVKLDSIRFTSLIVHWGLWNCRRSRMLERCKCKSNCYKYILYKSSQLIVSKCTIAIDSSILFICILKYLLQCIFRNIGICMFIVTWKKTYCYLQFSLTSTNQRACRKDLE